MPRLLDPDSTFPISLSGDMAKPEDVRPYFLCVPLTLGGMQLAITQLAKIRSIDEEDTDALAGALKATCDILDKSIVGWGNMLDHNVPAGQEPQPLYYTPENLRNLLQLDEAMELVGELVKGQQLSAEDKKKSASRATSARKPGARGARGGGA